MRAARHMSATLDMLVPIGASVAEAAGSASNGSVVAGHVHGAGAAGCGMSTVKMLINPPADVQSAVPAVIAACSKWQPMDVPAPAHPTIPTSTIASGLTEADVCGFIQHPDAQFWYAFNVFLILAVFVVAMCWAFRLHRLPGALWRLAVRLGRRVSA